MREDRVISLRVIPESQFTTYFVPSPSFAFPHPPPPPCFSTRKCFPDRTVGACISRINDPTRDNSNIGRWPFPPPLPPPPCYETTGSHDENRQGLAAGSPIRIERFARNSIWGSRWRMQRRLCHDGEDRVQNGGSHSRFVNMFVLSVVLEAIAEKRAAAQTLRRRGGRWGGEGQGRGGKEG